MFVVQNKMISFSAHFPLSSHFQSKMSNITLVVLLLNVVTFADNLINAEFIKICSLNIRKRSASR